jgi:hypothetical protein
VVRSWTLIVSLLVHALAAVVMMRVPMAMGHVERAAEAPIVAMEVAMVESRPRPPVLEPRAPEPPPAPPVAPKAAESEVASSQRPARAPSPASVTPRGESGAAAPGPTRSLSMRPGGEAKPAPDGQLPPLVDGRAPGQAAHDFGAALGAPLVNMLGPERPLPETGEPTLGHSVGGGRYEKKKLQFRAKIDEDGQVHFSDSPAWDGELFADPKEGVGYRASFDVTDALMRAHGMDPYWAAKLEWLDETRDERGEMALAARRERLRESLARMPGLLDAIWRDPRWSPSERRRLIFQLWDECAEDGPDEVVVAARQVRVTIEDFVRKRLPPGTPDAFPPPELNTLNASRTSHAEFRPY